MSSKADVPSPAGHARALASTRSRRALGRVAAALRAVVALSMVTALFACSRAAPDATPEGAVRLWLEKMESGAEDPRTMRDAYDLLGPRARTNLEARADRASRGQGRRFEPHEMLAEGRFALRFRPKAMASRTNGDDAWVDVTGDGPDEHAVVACTREGGAWRIEPELPGVVAPARRPDGGT